MVHAWLTVRINFFSRLLYYNLALKKSKQCNLLQFPFQNAFPLHLKSEIWTATQRQKEKKKHVERKYKKGTLNWIKLFLLYFRTPFFPLFSETLKNWMGVCVCVDDLHVSYLVLACHRDLHFNQRLSVVVVVVFFFYHTQSLAMYFRNYVINVASSLAPLPVSKPYRIVALLVFPSAIREKENCQKKKKTTAKRPTDF